MVLQYKLADLIGASVARVISNKAKFPSLYEAYPGAFDEEREAESKRQQDWRITKERLLQYTAAHNIKQKQMELKKERELNCQNKN